MERNGTNYVKIVEPAPVSKTEKKPTRDMLWFSLRFGHIITDKGDPNGINIQTGLANYSFITEIRRSCLQIQVTISTLPYLQGKQAVTSLSMLLLTCSLHVTAPVVTTGLFVFV
jgi:hypothetical protein